MTPITSSYQTPAFYADAQAALGQSLKGIVGGKDVQAVPPLNAKTSLTADVASLKAQQAALDLLHAVTGAAKTVLGHASTLLKAAPDPEQTPPSVHPVDDLLRGATFDGAPLFDRQVNHRTIGALMDSPEGADTLAIFSPEVRDSLTAAFENAFDIYA